MKKDESGRRSIEVEIELPCTPEEVWETIATGPGLAAWFMAMDFQPGLGEITVDTPEGPVVIGETTVWDPPNKMVGEGKGFGPEGPTVATEWHIESLAGGKCVLRVVNSFCATTDDWDDQLSDLENGWPRFFRVLRLFIERFREVKTAVPVQIVRPVALDDDEAWLALTDALGMANQPVGADVGAPVGSPPFAGSVAEAAGTELSRGLVVLSEPCAGIASPAVFRMGGQVVLHLSLYLYGDEAPTIAQRDAAAWQAWLDGLALSTGE